jgi:hypothetical protein
VETKELGKLRAVLRVLVDTELDVLAKRLPELVKVVLVLRNFREQIHCLLHNVLANDLQDLVLLKRLTRDVEWQILGIDNTLNEVEIFGDDLLAIVHDEHAANIEFDVVTLLFLLKEIEWCTETDSAHDTKRKDEDAYRLGI